MDRKRTPANPEHEHAKTDPPYQGADGRDIGTRIIRCLHTERGRPPHAGDAFEFHWRCTAKFQCHERDLPYCPYHLPIYAKSDRVTREDVERAHRAMDRYAQHVSMLNAIPFGSPEEG